MSRRAGLDTLVRSVLYLEVMWCGGGADHREVVVVVVVAADEGVIDTAKVRSMLELLAAEAGFLVDPKVSQWRFVQR